MRKIQDHILRETTALPAAGADNATAAIDLGSVEPFPANESFTAVVAIPATPALVDAKTITVTLEDSADGITFAPIASLAPVTVTGADAAGGPAVESGLRLPDNVRRFIRAAAAVEADGGNSAAVSYTLNLQF
ncbi:MAG: hypothetical protein JJU00_12765 [Opitutales bacterium]|nr:hypothetical protein [Opitutales bacterium]